MIDRSEAPAIAALVAGPARSEWSAYLAASSPARFSRLLHHARHVDTGQPANLASTARLRFELARMELGFGQLRFALVCLAGLSHLSRRSSTSPLEHGGAPGAQVASGPY